MDRTSFSNSRGLDSDFEVQRDQVVLIRAAMAVLKPDGVLYFSNNRRDFHLDESLPELFDCVDISRETLDVDFQRNAKIHRCWTIRHRENAMEIG